QGRSSAGGRRNHGHRPPGRFRRRLPDLGRRPGGRWSRGQRGPLPPGHGGRRGGPGGGVREPEMSSGRKLRELMSRGGLVVAPGAYDALTARLIEEAGFDAVYMTGAGTSASLGYPDYGMVTLSEMVETAGRLARAVGVPVIADSDTGYGNELNAIRAVQEFTSRGVAGIHVEDQVFPKRCGHLDDKQVIAAEDYLTKVRMMAAGRPDPDLVLIARTDARAPLGFEAAIERANAALAAGADCIFVE